MTYEQRTGTDLRPAAVNNGRFGFSEKLVVLHDPHSLEVESIASLRNQLVSKHLQDGKRSLAICGATAGVGVSFVAANLAVAMAQAGVHTLLLDCNLREPSLDQYFLSEQPTRGLSDYLASDQDSELALINPDVIPNLSIMFSGSPTEQAQRLLSKTRFQTLIENCVRSFDLTIVDCPPASSSADTRRIAALVRHALVIARKDRSYLSDMRRLITELQTDRANVIGSFLNVIE
ncbi:CpsD/CapB family tyrosine-protein kinase [Sphingopyxis sp. L1A2A]|uniref:CpsD/CapB family tyrosine-protein kinase n=1 Tax=Sphingopyxis sp. L1A2A TaxID=2502247 RepID=UPI0010F7CDB6|nr:CpsD/CapB family tyrosine-protein kinase [Sphingopyxis sp. L1A2A]